MSLQETILVAGMASTLIPVIAIFFRDRSVHTTVPTLLTAIAVVVHLGAVLRFVQIGSGQVPEVLHATLFTSILVSLLGGFALSAGFGREDPAAAFRDSRRTFVLLAIVGLGLLSFVGRSSFVAGYTWDLEKGTIFIGPVGKAFLTYGLVAVILIGYNLEKTYRIASADIRHRLRLPLFSAFAGLFYATFILTMGMLYSSMGLGKFVAAALPVMFASVVIGYGYVKGSLSDVAAPVSRTIVYSSFTAMTAGLFVAAVGMAGQIATWTEWSPDEILVLAFGILVALSAALLVFSNRFQRQVRRFIDRNFYVNRYDYRTQWSTVTAAFVSATDRESVLEAAMRILRETFLADDVTIALVDRTSNVIRVERGKGSDTADVVLPQGTPLHLMLCEGSKSLLINRKDDDFTFIPVYAENGSWLDATASEIVAPLLEGEQLIGTIGLERSREDDHFTYEDVALLDSIAAHVAAALRSSELSEELAERREMELMSNLSSMVLHDLKNYLSPLRLVASNLNRFKDDPDAVVSCATDVTRVTEKMGSLVEMLSKLREKSHLTMEVLDPNDLVKETLGATLLASRSDVDVHLELEAEARMLGDQGMLRRVLENLIGNAVEAMPDGGRLTIRTHDTARDGASVVSIGVEDTGVGMSEEFLRERLFRPFATTKTCGLGLGLYQCRSIVQVHGGTLTARSELGLGTRFQIALASAAPTSVVEVVESERMTGGLADERV